MSDRCHQQSGAGEAAPSSALYFPLQGTASLGSENCYSSSILPPVKMLSVSLSFFVSPPSIPLQKSPSQHGAGKVTIHTLETNESEGDLTN